MQIPLPPVGSNTPADRMKMSYRFLEHAQEELDKGNRLQASEKVWGATSQALKSIGIKRGWNHDEHVSILAIASQLALEHARPDLTLKVDAAEAHHGNFYSNVKYPNAIQEAISSTEEPVMELDDILDAPYRPYKIEDNTDVERLFLLTGHRYSIGEYSETGFAQHPRRRRRRRSRWTYQRANSEDHPNQDDDTDGANGGGTPVTFRPRNGGPTPAGGQSNPVPKPCPAKSEGRDFALKPGKRVSQGSTVPEQSPKDRRSRRPKTKNGNGQSPNVNIQFR